MKRLLLILMTALVTTPAGFAREQTILARITVYWPSSSEPQRASSNGAKLRNGHCAVDPKRIPYGSRVIFPDLSCLAIDSGPAVVSRLAARKCAKTALQREALVIDRYFETRSQALIWAATHPHFMNVQVSDSRQTIVVQNEASHRLPRRLGPPKLSKTSGELSSEAHNSTRNPGDAPAENSGPLLLTPSGTALPRS